MLKRFFIFLSCLTALLLLFASLFLFYIHTPVQSQNPAVTIGKGATLRQVTAQLESQKIIRQGWVFLLYAHLSGKGSHLKAGDYLFEEKTTPKEVLEKLVRGIVVLNKVQIIEGWTLKQIADSFSQLEFIESAGFAEEFLHLTAHPSLEGYLLPDTYSFPKGVKPEEMIKIFTEAFQNFYREALLGLQTLPVFSQHEIVTLASIIEKETGKEEERTIIASVFYNRLRKKMPLASDPTVIYGLKNFSGNLTKSDLGRPHPYNTYIRTGLPPGPICNPGRASILSALKPAETDFLYFVSKGGGTHHFSKTPAEHAEAVRKYQIGPSSKF